MFEFEENLGTNAKIKVIGVGGGGGNSIKRMMKEIIDGVDFVAINTDVQALKQNDAMIKIQIGSKITKGLGSGSNPLIGKEAAMEDENLIRETLMGSDMVFITAGMGGGTGTGAAPIIGKIAKDLGVLTVGVVTKPFAFEGRKRLMQAEEGIKALRENVDTLICLPNDNLLTIVGKDTPIIDSFKMVDQVVHQAVRGISDLITTPGLINLDFADIKTIMMDSGLALMGTGVASGEGRALQATKMAITSPLLENISISGATGIILNITGTSHMTLFEVNEASKFVQQECDEEVNIIFGTVIDDNMADDIRVTVIATGFGKQIKNIKDRTVQESRQFQCKDWLGANKKTSPEKPPAPKKPALPEIENDASSIESIFNESQRSSFVTSQTPEKEPQNELFSESSQPQTVWGEDLGFTPPEKDLTPSTSKLNRRPTNNAIEKSELRQMMNSLNLNETDSEEYDIPAFIRRRAD